MEGRALRSARPDVVLLELKSNDKTARQTLRSIPAFSDDSAVIVLADQADESHVQALLEFEAHDFLLKDLLTKEKLQVAIHNAHRRRQQDGTNVVADQHYRQWVSDNPDGALVTDLRGEILYVNPVATKMLPSLSAGDSLAKVGLHLPGLPEEVIQVDGDRTIEARYSRIEWDRESSWLVTLRDVGTGAQLDELRARLAQSEKLAVIGQLAAGVAHEINNPLAFILANLSATLGHVHHLESMLAELRGLATRGAVLDAADVSAVLDRVGRDMFGELKEMLEDNLDGAHRIRSIVRELKTFSRREDEEHELIGVNELVKSTCRIMAPQIRHRARLVKELADVRPVMGSRGKLAQILTNLLMNAVQALPELRRPDDRIEVRTSQQGTFVVVSVTDTGGGIAEDVQRRIFEPFFTTKTREDGTGIGLSLSAELARQHDGELLLRQSSPQGSTFELRLPGLDAVRLVNTVEAPSGAPSVAFDGTRHRILLVDDEPNVRKGMMRILRSFDVVTASNGREALDAIAQHRFDAIICDLMMPDFDGVDVHDALSHDYPDLLDRVIFTSGGAYTPRTAAFVGRPNITYVEKPVQPADLLGLLQDVLAPVPETTDPVKGTGSALRSDGHINSIDGEVA